MIAPQYLTSLTGLRQNTLNHVLVTGQSIAVGSGDGQVISTVPQPAAFLLRGQYYEGTALDLGEDRRSLRQLVEWPDAVQGTGETQQYGFVGFVQGKAAQLGAAHYLLISNWARSGATYAMLKRSPATSSPQVQATGTNPYLRGMAQVMAGRQIAGARHKVRAILVVHGESDSLSVTYDTDIRQWQLDCETDYLALTGQTGRVPMFHSQTSSWTISGFATIPAPVLVLKEHKANPTKTTLVCAKYFLTHAPDGLHMSAQSARLLGEYYGKAYWQQVILGTQWNPLYPSSVVRAGSVIDVTFTGAVGPLVLDTGLVTNPGNYGFEYTDDTAPPAITGVFITGPTTVRVTLASTPSGANKKLRYAYTGITGAKGGPTSGPRGCLRDSDPTPSVFGAGPLYNWCVHFEEAAT